MIIDPVFDTPVFPAALMSKKPKANETPVAPPLRTVSVPLVPLGPTTTTTMPPEAAAPLPQSWTWSHQALCLRTWRPW